MIQYKNSERFSQLGNDETANIREHTCEAKWDGLQYRNTLWKILINMDEEKSLNKSNRPENWILSRKISDSMASPITDTLPTWNSLWGINEESKNTTLGMGISQDEAKKVGE